MRALFVAAGTGRGTESWDAAAGGARVGVGAVALTVRAMAITRHLPITLVPWPRSFEAAINWGRYESVVLWELPGFHLFRRTWRHDPPVLLWATGGLAASPLLANVANLFPSRTSGPHVAAWVPLTAAQLLMASCPDVACSYEQPDSERLICSQLLDVSIDELAQGVAVDDAAAFLGDAELFLDALYEPEDEGSGVVPAVEVVDDVTLWTLYKSMWQIYPADPQAIAEAVRACD